MRPNDAGKMRKYDNNNNNNNIHNNVSKNLNKERFAYVMTCLIGNEVTVHMKDGNEVKGLFHAYNCTNKSDRDKHERGGGAGGGAGGGEKGEKNDRQEKHEIDISLNYGRVLPKNDKLSGPINKAMIIPENNYKAIIGKDIKLDLKDPDEVKSRKEKFKIDADISEKKKNTNSVNRELKRWMCDDDDTFDDNKLKLDKTAEPWDQFEQNRKMYGVTTTYKEEIYTTNLDINKVPHHVKIHADKIAKELEKRGMHLDPEDAERDNKNLDEEDLFGAVRTNVKDKYNKNQKYKKEETKPKTYQGKFHPLVIKDLKEKIQSVKRENEKKYPNKQKPESCEPSSSNDDTNSTANANANRKTKLPSTPKKEISQNSDFIGINALNLEPAMPKLDDKTRSEWIIFKNKVKHKTVNKKDKNADKLEFMTAAKEFNERLAGKMNLKNKEPSSRPAKEHSLTTQTTSSNQKNVSTSTYKPKHTVNGSENKPANNNIFTNPGNINYNANNVMMNNSNMRPHDFYMYNCNTFNNMKNNMVPHNIDFYPNMPMILDSQNQMYHYGEHMYKHDGMNPVYSYGGHMGGFRPNFPLNLPIFPQNMKMGEVLVSDLHSSPNAQTKDSSNDELIPFPLKIRENKASFSDFIAGVLNYSKKENCVECEIGFKSTYQFSYKNVLGEIPPHVPLNYLPPPPAGYPNNMSPLEPPLPNSNIANVPINYQFIPIMPPNVNNANPYMENPVYVNPFYPNFYSNNNNSNMNDNSINANTNNSVTNNISRGNSSNMPYMYNIPGSNMDNSYSSNKNMNMYPIRNPLHFHASNNMNFPLSSCIPPPHMNYPLNNNAMNMINNPNMPSSNMNMTPYPSDMVLMNPQKFANTNLDPNQNHNQSENHSHNFNQNPNQNPNHNPNQNPNANINPNPNPNINPSLNPNLNPNINPNLNPNINPNPNANINSLASAPPQPMHPQFMPPYPYPSYYTPSHGVN